MVQKAVVYIGAIGISAVLLGLAVKFAWMGWLAVTQ